MKKLMAILTGLLVAVGSINAADSALVLNETGSPVYITTGQGDFVAEHETEVHYSSGGKFLVETEDGQCVELEGELCFSVVLVSLNEGVLTVTVFE